MAVLHPIQPNPGGDLGERLREIDDRAERERQEAVREAAAARVVEYRAAQQADDLHVIIRVPALTAWHLEALRFVAAGNVDFDRWRQFLADTRPEWLAGQTKPELEQLSDLIDCGFGGPFERFRLTRLGIAVLADIDGSDR